MLKRKSIFLVLAIIIFVLALTCAVGSIYTMLFYNSDVFLKISAGFSVIAICSAFVYVFRGFRKQEVNYFNFFIIAFALSLFGLAISLTDVNTLSRLNIALIVISFGLSIYLVASKDLGRFKSFIIWAIITLLGIGIFLFNLDVVIALFKEFSGVNLMYFLYMVSHVVLCFILGLIITGKYIDKINRGRQC